MPFLGALERCRCRFLAPGDLPDAVYDALWARLGANNGIVSGTGAARVRDS